MHDLDALMEYYRTQGAPGDQTMLIALLREAQEMGGGTLPQETLARVAQFYQLKPALLSAIIRRIPSLRTQEVPHRLEMCAACPKGRELRAWVESTWQLKSGGICAEAGFSYHTVPCMKNCRNGPSVKWDGKLYSHSTRELLEQLIQTGGK